MSYPGAMLALEEVMVVRETCEDCGTDLRVVETYLAEEGKRELEIVLWTCPECGDPRETSEPAADPRAA